MHINVSFLYEHPANNEIKKNYFAGFFIFVVDEIINLVQKVKEVNL